MERSDTGSRVIWGTGITSNYVERAKPFLRTVEQYGQKFDARKVVTVGFVASPELRAEFPSIDFLMLPYGYDREGVQKLIVCENEKGIVQQGEFLRAIKTQDPDDVILFTDSDMVMQREPDYAEMQKLRTLGFYEVGLGPCAGPGRDALMQEAERLYPIADLKAIKLWMRQFLDAREDALDRFHVYCTGVVAATRGAWSLMYQQFVDHYPTMRRFFAHYARIQWLMSLIFDAPPFKVWSLPYEFTSHGCYGCPPPVKIKPDGVAAVGDTPVMFRHAL